MARGVTERARQHDNQPATNGQKARLVLSVLASAAAAASVGGVCALLYPVIGELRAERVRRDDGTEERMLGFWSILVLCLLAFIICSSFSLMLTYLNSYRPGMAFPTFPLPTGNHPYYRDVSGYDVHWSYGVALLNGVMATLAVIWTLF
ncbi:ADP-ribosylation factor-like protein 6-interacting protein 6 [Gouania willdenowi]|uniref:ADP-ribosylation factor-like protein 6-interacting protein 6 n=1 Tax=Gouania willdenowi TaxID=441366 RepID=A0A8C5E8K7_GOUWI|nr:ADP-ribosylation factor-like protein 6-interacting protein 6 [Gouania willdenowi]